MPYLLFSPTNLESLGSRYSWNTSRRLTTRVISGGSFIPWRRFYSLWFEAPPHLVSAFATMSHLVLGQEAVADKSNELTAIPILLTRLAEGGRLHGALFSSMPSPSMAPSRR